MIKEDRIITRKNSPVETKKYIEKTQETIK